MKRLLIVGGGHAHVEVLRRLALGRPHRLRITLVNPAPDAPYSGMLPGLIAGHHGWRDTHIDLRLLASRADAALVVGAVAAIDPDSRVAHCEDGTTLDWDVCSIDVGSVPSMSARGAREHAIAIKPVERFLERWALLLKRIDEGAVKSIAVVGGGAGGVEILLAMQHAILARSNASSGSSSSRSSVASSPSPSSSASSLSSPSPRFHLLTDSPSILPTHPDPVRQVFERVLGSRDVNVMTGARVDAIESTASDRYCVRCADGRSVDADAVFWTTSASAPPWIAASGFAVDERGFLRVDRSLRSVSHPSVLGAGDAVAVDGLSLPKAGVFAVRQAPVLAHNLRAALDDQPLPAFQPFETDTDALNLITTGDRRAVMSWKGHALEGRWVWWWKDWIDRRFMRRYR